MDTQYCVKILSHPSFFCILLQRSQIFLEFLKYSWAIGLQAFWASSKVFYFIFGHWLFFHPFSVRSVYLTIFRGMRFLLFFHFLSYLKITYESFKHKKSTWLKGWKSVVSTHNRQVCKKTNKPILYLIYFISLGMKNVFISQRFISRKLDMVPPSPWLFGLEL